MRIILLLFVCAAGRVGMAQKAVSGITDGPYVFYRNGVCYVKSVELKNGVYAGKVDSFSEIDKSAHELAVHLDGHPEWDFTVRLRGAIHTPADTSAKTDRAARRMLILSDIEGEFEHFRDLLLATKVIDKHYRWRFGRGRLIIAGDLFDRGVQVAQYLWLLYKLEDEAALKGGEVHVVLGNHDIMNLDGDFRYVRPEYMANGNLMNEEYPAFYGPDTELGRWLRSKNTIERVGELLVMHGGVSPEILARRKTIHEINEACRPWYAISPERVPDSVGDFFGEAALWWYRGYFLEPKAGMGLIDSTLAFYGAEKIVVGHDIIDHVAMLYDGKVVGVDVNEHEAGHEGVLIRRGKYYQINDLGKKAPL